MQREFGPIANDEVDRLGREVSAVELKAMFWREYIERTRPWELVSFRTESEMARSGAAQSFHAMAARRWSSPEWATGRLAALVQRFQPGWRAAF